MNSDEVDYIMGDEKDGANYIVLYLKLCLNLANFNGKFIKEIGEIIVPYDEEKIKRECKWFSVSFIKKALELYKWLGLVYEDKDGFLALSDYDNLVGSETDYAAKKRRQREGKDVDISGDISGDIVPIDIRDKDIRDKDIRNINIYNNQQTGEKTSLYEQVMDLYHSLCPSLAKVSKVTEKRKEAVKALLDTYCIKDVETMFKKAEASDFLTGRIKGSTWKANFDWLIKKENFIKVIEDAYINCAQSQKTNSANSNYDWDKLQRKAFENINKASQKEGGGKSPSHIKSIKKK